jgi:hypothetical protein
VLSIGLSKRNPVEPTQLKTLFPVEVEHKLKGEVKEVDKMEQRKEIRVLK